jgi:cytochrome c oxidase subunit I+III
VARDGMLMPWLLAGALGLVIAMVVLALMIGQITPGPQVHALSAVSFVLLGYVALHAGIGLLFLLSTGLRRARGFISVLRRTDLRLNRLWLDYTILTGIIAVGIVAAMPVLIGTLDAKP